LLVSTGTWSSVWANLEEGKCSTVIAYKERPLKHSKGELCDYGVVGSPVVVVGLGMPVKEELNSVFSWIMRKERMGGGFLRVEQEDPAEASTCSALGKGGEDGDHLSKLQLQPKNMLGTSMVLGLCMLVGLVVRLLTRSKTIVEKHVFNGNFGRVMPMCSAIPAKETGSKAEAGQDIKEMIHCLQVQLSAVQENLGAVQQNFGISPKQAAIHPGVVLAQHASADSVSDCSTSV